MTLLPQVSAGYAPVENGELYYEVAGAGHPLLLIHAGVADRRMWDDQFASFAERYRVIRYDTRGFGLSRTEPTSFSNQQDVADLFRHLGSSGRMSSVSRAAGRSPWTSRWNTPKWSAR